MAWELNKNNGQKLWEILEGIKSIIGTGLEMDRPKPIMLA